MLKCPSCGERKLVNSNPLSKFVACHGCKKIFELKETEPVNPFEKFATTVKLGTINTEGE